MATKKEVGTWTADGSSPQTITLQDGSFGTPIAIIVRMAGRDSGPSAGSFASHGIICIGFGTRRSGSTQSGCMSFIDIDNVATTDAARVRNTTLLHVPASTTTTDYTVSLDSFGSGTFTVSYSSAANASGDLFEYEIYGGSDLTDAIVINQLFDSTGATEVVTGTGFLPSVVFGLEANLASANAFSAHGTLSFGWATSATRFWSNTIACDDGATMTSSMRHNMTCRSDAFIERFTAGGTTSDARWDLDSFDSDGATLGVVDAPTGTTGVNPLLFIKGGVWEAGNFNKSASAGDQTVTLANGSLTPVGLMLGLSNGVAGTITPNSYSLCVGGGSTPHTTRGSAVNNVTGVADIESINTTCDRFRATDSVIEALLGGGTPSENNEAWYDSVAAGSFTIEWVSATATASTIGYLAVGSEAAAAESPTHNLFGMTAVQRAAFW